MLLANNREVFGTILLKIHGQNSFGEPTVILTKDGEELSNYLRVGGYKYLFINYLQNYSKINNLKKTDVFPAGKPRSSERGSFSVDKLSVISQDQP